MSTGKMGSKQVRANKVGTKAKMHPSLGAAALIMEEEERRRQAKAQREAALSPNTSSLAWLMSATPGKKDSANGAAAPAGATAPSASPATSTTPATTTPAATAASTTPPIPGAEPGEDLAAMLVRLSRSGADMMNTREYEKHWMYGNYSDDYTACVAEQNDWMTMKESLDHFRAIARKHPQFRIDIVEGTAQVDERWGVAEVFQSLEITGQPPGMVRQGMVVLEWRRQPDGRWMCCKLTGLRGITGSGAGD